MLTYSYVDRQLRAHAGQWHTGEPVPPIQRSRVVQFNVDGDELDLILRAMEAKCYASCPGHGFVHP